MCARQSAPSLRHASALTLRIPVLLCCAGVSATGMAGGGMGGWQGQQQGYMPAGSQQMQNWG